MSIEKLFTPTLSAKDCVDTVREEGAVLVRKFIDEPSQEELTAQVLSHNLTPVDRSSHTIPEQFHDIGWEYRHAPPAIVTLGKRVCNLVRPEVPAWFVNHVRGQLYSPGEVGIEWHRDYKRDLRVIAVASLLQKARFDIRLASGEVSWDLLPGDLVLMRGALLNSRKDDRPPHRVLAPETGQRLSIAFRQVSQEVPELEPADE